MKYLLDASALLPLLTKHGKQLIIEASRENLVTTDLAIYEACNSLWKLATLLKTISIKEAIDVATALKDLTTKNIIQPINFTKLDFTNTLSKAYKKQLTFYDASYITAAESTQAILVTEDEKLRKTANKFVKTITYTDLETKLTRR